MKGKIDSQGFLKIYRGDADPGLYNIQYCPFANMSLEIDNTLHFPTPCGQWCPHFGDPEEQFPVINVVNGETLTSNSDKMILNICHGKTLIFEEFEVEE